jgi:hypothetical protein
MAGQRFDVTVANWMTFRALGLQYRSFMQHEQNYFFIW